jgi:predicted extracellular nuclease
MKKLIIMALAMLVIAIPAANAAVVEITEWCYSGNDGEFIEFTNVSGANIDFTGWSFDDDSRVWGTIDLSGFGIVAPGECVILTEIDAATFRSNWNLAPWIKIIGGNTANLGRNDEINIYSGSTLIDRLTFGDQSFPGTPRTQYKSCNIPKTDFGYTTAQTTWTLASVGDSFNSWIGKHGDIGSPGVIPEPSSVLALSTALVGFVGFCHRRK